MLHNLFYFGVLLPTLVVVLFFIVFLICWYKCNLRQRFMAPKFHGGSHNSTQTSLVSATSSNCPPSKDYWDDNHRRINRSETQQTSLFTSAKYVPGEFPTLSRDENWRYMSRNSVELYRRNQEGKEVWTTKCTSDTSLDSTADQWHERDSGIQVRGAHANYALLDDECMDCTEHRVQISPPQRLGWSNQRIDDLSPHSDTDTYTPDVSPQHRPPRDDDNRHSSQLNFVSANYRTHLNGYTNLVPMRTSNDNNASTSNTTMVPTTFMSASFNPSQYRDSPVRQKIETAQYRDSPVRQKLDAQDLVHQNGLIPALVHHNVIPPAPNVQHNGIPAPNIQHNGIPAPNVQHNGIKATNQNGIAAPNVHQTGIPAPNLNGIPAPNLKQNGMPAPNVHENGISAPNTHQNGRPAQNGISNTAHLTNKISSGQTPETSSGRYQCSPYAVTDIRAPVISV